MNKVGVPKFRLFVINKGKITVIPGVVLEARSLVISEGKLVEKRQLSVDLVWWSGADNGIIFHNGYSSK